MAKIDVGPLSSYQIKEPMMGNASPLLLFGILLFVLPFFRHLVKIPFPAFFTVTGIIFIIAGVIHSGIKMYS